MEFHLPNEISASTNYSLFALLLMFIFGAFLWINISSREAGDKRLPPPPPEAAGSWPLIGHLHLLGGPEPLHKTLSKIADKCGPIFMIKLGVRRVIVVSNWKVAKECLDLSRLSFFQIIGLRCLLMSECLRLIVGKSLRELSENERGKCQRAIRGFFELAATIVPADALPFLRWLDIGSHEKAIKKAAQELNDVIQCWLEEHKRDGGLEDVTIKKDFMDVMLEKLDGPNSVLNSECYEADVVVKATCLILILGGSGTSSVILTWALSLLLNNRHVLKKAKEELDFHVGRKRQIHESDMKNLGFLKAILKETLRLYPAAPLAIPHEAITDCCVSGYHIPAGTRLFLNLHKIHRDPEVWLDPTEFRPERFLSTSHKDVDVKGQNFELIPFGSGRRMCPAGISFALPIMEFTLASLLHNFDVGSQSDEFVDMTEGCGLTNLKASRLDVALIPCLHDNHYNARSWE